MTAASLSQQRVQRNNVQTIPDESAQVHLEVVSVCISVQFSPFENGHTVVWILPYFPQVAWLAPIVQRDAS